MNENLLKVTPVLLVFFLVFGGDFPWALLEYHQQLFNYFSIWFSVQSPADCRLESQNAVHIPSSKILTAISFSANLYPYQSSRNVSLQSLCFSAWKTTFTNLLTIPWSERTYPVTKACLKMFPFHRWDMLGFPGRYISISNKIFHKKLPKFHLLCLP